MACIVCLILNAIKVCLIVGTVGGLEITAQPKNDIAFPVQDTLQHTDETNLKLDDLHTKSVEDTATAAAPESISNRNIIDAPARPCQHCYRRDHRGVCRRIIGCSRDAGSTNEKSVEGITTVGATPESTDNRAVIDAPGRPCQPCYRRDHRGLCRKIIGCSRDAGISDIVEISNNEKSVDLNITLVDDTIEIDATSEGEDVGNRAIIDAPVRPCQPCYRRDHRGVCRKIIGCSRDAGIPDIVDASNNEKSVDLNITLVDDTIETDATSEGEDVGNRAIIDAPARPCQPCYRRDHRGVCRKIIGCSRDTGTTDFIEPSSNEKLVQDVTAVEATPDDTDNRAIIDAPDRPCQACYRRDSRGVCRRIIDCSRDARIADFIEVSTNEKTEEDSSMTGTAPEGTDNRAIIDAPGRPCQPCYRRDHRGVCRKIVGCARDAGMADFIEPPTNEKSAEDNTRIDVAPEGTDNRVTIDASSLPLLDLLGARQPRSLS